VRAKIAILRGINVGGKRKILMADLKSLCKKLGWKEVSTYIQSGNIIFQSDVGSIQLEEELAVAISDQYGYDVPVIVRTKEELQNAIRQNPFYDAAEDISKLHLTFLKERPKEENVHQTETYNYEPDQFVIDNQDVFISCEGKYHESKLTNGFFEKKLKVGATTRNWKTVLKLAELSKA